MENDLLDATLPQNLPRTARVLMQLSGLSQPALNLWLDWRRLLVTPRRGPFGRVGGASFGDVTSQQLRSGAQPRRWSLNQGRGRFESALVNRSLIRRHERGCRLTSLLLP